MGQTLTHGVYLPDEGERNCYDGLAANWQLLDGAVGTIAEHTSALAGKAPLVHTHGKADITDFPVYGTTAGTICEGNDSRLSDARTPVAHTHSKSDVTDLFNSANTWSGSQTFTENSIFSNFITSKESAAIPAGGFGKGIEFRDYQNNRLGYIQPHLTSGSEKRLLIGADAGDIAINSSLIPYVNNSYNLGTSTNKWKTFNGINPGALSLPNVDSDGYIDLSDNISINTEYSYIPTVDGWLALYVQTTGFHAENAVGIFTGGGSSTSYRWACSATSAINLPRGNAYHGAVMLPVKAGRTYLCCITIDSSTTLSTKRLYFYKATGNV